MWGNFMKDCAFYYDVPTIDEENKMKRTLQRKYDSILAPGWRPALTSRRDLLSWACSQVNNTYAPAAGVEEKDLLDCEDNAKLVRTFGPDYDRLRPKLGYIKGLFD